MVLLNTKFYVSDEFNRQVLFDLIQSWLGLSKQYDLDVSAFDFSQVDFKAELDDGSQCIIINNYVDKFIYQVIKQDDVVKFINSFILDDKSDKPIMSVQLEKEYCQATVSKDKSFALPQLLKEVFWNEYGGNDNGLMTDDKAYIIRKSDVQMAYDIITKQMSCLNPIVYVSPYAASGNYAVNYDRIARELIGLAHVVVEGSPKVSNDIHELTGGLSPFDGVVDILLPNGQGKRLIPSGKNFNYKVVDEVMDIMSKVAIDDEFNVLRIRYNHKLQDISVDPELQSVFDEILNEKDAELASKNELIDKKTEELADCKAIIMRLTAKIDALQRGFDTKGVTGNIQIVTNESDLYEGEIMDVLLRLIQKEVNSMDSDDNTRSSRKYHVLKSILDTNSMSGKREEYIQIFKSAFKDGCLSQDGVRNLKSHGFIVEKTKGNSHYKIVFADDDRYQIVFSSTTSDKKSAAENNVSTFCNVLFGY